MSVTEVAENSDEKVVTTNYFDLSKPRWDQSTFIGRLRHFAAITDVRKALATSAKLDEAKEIVTSCR